MILTVHAKPGARESKVAAVLDENTVKIAIAAPAIQGKANEELIRFLAKKLGVAKISIEVIRGKGTRLKHVKIEGIKETEAQNLFPGV